MLYALGLYVFQIYLLPEYVGSVYQCFSLKFYKRFFFLYRSERKRADSNGSSTSLGHPRSPRLYDDSTSSPSILDAPTPPHSKHSSSFRSPVSPFFPATSPTERSFFSSTKNPSTPESQPGAPASVLQSLPVAAQCLQCYHRRQSATTSGSDRMSCSAASSRRASLDSRCNHTKVDVSVQLVINDV